MGPSKKQKAAARRGDRCFYCGERFGLSADRRMTTAHKNPKCAGGGSAVKACSGCNNEMGPLDHRAYMRVRDDKPLLRHLVRLTQATLQGRIEGPVISMAEMRGYWEAAILEYRAVNQPYLDIPPMPSASPADDRQTTRSQQQPSDR